LRELDGDPIFRDVQGAAARHAHDAGSIEPSDLQHSAVDRIAAGNPQVPCLVCIGSNHWMAPPPRANGFPPRDVMAFLQWAAGGGTRGIRYYPASVGLWREHRRGIAKRLLRDPAQAYRRSCWREMREMSPNM